MADHADADFREDFAELAVNTTFAGLKAALSFPQIKKLIVISSSAALLPVSVLTMSVLEYEVQSELFARLTATSTETQLENTAWVIPVNFDAEFPSGVLG